MKRSESAELVMLILGAYPNAKTTSGTSGVYESLLADLDAKAARQAVQQLIATSRFMPTIAEIREATAALVQARVAAAARERAARRPRLTRDQLVQRDAKRTLR